MTLFCIIIESSYSTPPGEYGSLAMCWQLEGWMDGMDGMDGREGGREGGVSVLDVGRCQGQTKQDVTQERLCRHEKQNDGLKFIL